MQQQRVIGMVNWIGLWTLYAREVHRFMKIIFQTVLSPMISSLLYFWVFSVILHQRGVPLAPGISFAAFIAPGLIMMTILENAFVNTSYSLLISKVQGNIVDILVPPLSPMELTLGILMGGVTRGLIVGLCTGIFIFLFARMPVHHPLIVVYFALMASLMNASLGVIGGLWSEKFEQLQVIVSFVITPLSFLSGTFYPIHYLPALAQKLTLFNPFYYLVDGLRYGFLSISAAPSGTTTDPHGVFVGGVVLIFVNVILFTVCYLLFRRGYKLKS